MIENQQDIITEVMKGVLWIMFLDKAPLKE